jgi:hypothetical protein
MYENIFLRLYKQPRYDLSRLNELYVSEAQISSKPKVHRFSKMSEPSRSSKRQNCDIKFHTEDPKILGATLRNLVPTATWHTGFVHP